ncbi:MAG: PQQ-binding-like beta-propeller repeat protein [Acidobacteria bacterium]|nr:PQQ-binding-like beta-propeller repeat protein [Acidobacteriota bacterium]
MQYIRTAILLSVAWLLIPGDAAVLIAEENPYYFRSDGGVVSLEAGSLPERLSSSEGLRWRTAIDSGHSTPAFCSGRIFLTTYNTASEELATMALAADTGRILWKRIAPASGIEEYSRDTGSAAQATPACDEERIYVFFGSYGLICYDHRGTLLWEKRMGPFQDEYGSASSPVLIDDKIIILQDHDVDSFLMALDRKTGKVLWKSERQDATRSYSTPAVWTRNGRKELLVAGSRELAGYDPSDGKRLWWIHGLARIVIPTPVPAGDLVYMGSWTPGGDSSLLIRMEPWSEALRKRDANNDGRLTRNEVTDKIMNDRFFPIDLDQDGELIQAEWERYADIFAHSQNGVLAIKPSGAGGEQIASAVIWKSVRGAPYVATPLLDRGILWTVRDGGIVTRFSAADGKILEMKRLTDVGNFYASPVSAGGRVYIAGRSGVVTVIANDPEWRVLYTHDFEEGIYATPLIAEGCLFIRTEKALYCFGKGN